MLIYSWNSKTCVKRPLSQKDRILDFKTNHRLMQAKSIAECSPAILLTCIKLPFVIKIFVLSILEWPFYTCFTVLEVPISFDEIQSAVRLRQHL